MKNISLSTAITLCATIALVGCDFSTAETDGTNTFATPGKRSIETTTVVDTKPEETKAISKGAGILTPDQVANVLIKGMAKGRKMIIPGFDAQLTYYLRRWCPGLVDFVMDRTILKTQKQKL